MLDSGWIVTRELRAVKMDSWSCRIFGPAVRERDEKKEKSCERKARSYKTPEETAGCPRSDSIANLEY
jgi:hypothetical protein